MPSTTLNQPPIAIDTVTMDHSPASDAASIDITLRCDKKIYSAPCLRDLDGLDTTEGGTQLNSFESLNGALSS